MKKFYLIDKLPENSPYQDYPDDISKTLKVFRDEKNQYQHKAPNIRPHPLDKYEIADKKVAGEETEISQVEREERILAGGPLDTDERAEIEAERPLDPNEQSALDQSRSDGGWMFRPDEVDAAIASLPVHARVRAAKIVPWLQDINLGDARLHDVLYDLAVPRAKKIHTKNIGLLRTVYSQLDSKRDLPPSLLQRKLAMQQESDQRTRRYARNSIYTRPGFQNHPRQRLNRDQLLCLIGPTIDEVVQ